LLHKLETATAFVAIAVSVGILPVTVRMPVRKTRRVTEVYKSQPIDCLIKSAPE